jgi:multiple antibiotic resistance protein
LLLSSIDSVMGKSGSDNVGDGSGGKSSDPALDIAIYPVAIPLVASVSGLVAIVSLLAQHDDPASLLSLTGVTLGIMAINCLCLRFCQLIMRAAGPATLQVPSKLMGVILTALAVELFLSGLNGLGLIARPAAG